MCVCVCVHTHRGSHAGNQPHIYLHRVPPLAWSEGRQKWAGLGDPECDTTLLAIMGEPLAIDTQETKPMTFCRQRISHSKMLRCGLYPPQRNICSVLWILEGTHNAKQAYELGQQVPN